MPLLVLILVNHFNHMGVIKLKRAPVSKAYFYEEHAYKMNIYVAVNFYCCFLIVLAGSSSPHSPFSYKYIKNISLLK